MADEVNTRKYDARQRRAAAAQTRERILSAARELFTTRGYEGTAITEIARAADVSIDTVYASVGRKPRLLLAVHDMELANAAAPVDAEDRDYVREIRTAGSAAEKIRLYAAAMAERLPRTVPLMVALRDAGAREPECLAVYREVSDRRATGTVCFAADLRSTGDLRDDLADDEIATLVWSMNSPDYFLLLAERGYTPEEYAALVTGVWERTFLSDPGTVAPHQGSGA